MPNKDLGQIRTDNPPSLPLEGDELIYMVQDGDDTAVTPDELLSGQIGVTGEGSARTTNYTLAPADQNVLVETSGTLTITCPASGSVVLQPPGGQVFFHHVRHLGGGTLTIAAGAGATVTPPAGGSLTLSSSGQTITIALSTVTAESFMVIGSTDTGV